MLKKLVCATGKVISFSPLSYPCPEGCQIKIAFWCMASARATFRYKNLCQETGFSPIVLAFVFQFQIEILLGVSEALWWGSRAWFASSFRVTWHIAPFLWILVSSLVKYKRTTALTEHSMPGTVPIAFHINSF